MIGAVRAIAVVVAVVGVTGPQQAAAQQPFVVDDAEVTPPRTWHLEMATQVDGLRDSARPTRWQNTFDAELIVGVALRLELGVALPLLSLIGRDAGRWHETSGLGDASVAAKWRLTRDPDARHAFAASAAIEIPSGDRDRNLGSGLVDYGLTLGSQHRLDDRWTLRVNGGAVLAGNTQSGVVGIRQRGTVLNGGASLSAQRDRLRLGAELSLAWSQRALVGSSFAAAQIGGNLAVAPSCTLDFAVGTGWFETSPRWSLQVGVSLDVFTP